MNQKIENHSTVVIYSQGNFISSQRIENRWNPYKEDRLMISSNIVKSSNSGEVYIDTAQYIPT